MNLNFDNKNGQVQPCFYTRLVWIIFYIWMILWVLDSQYPKIQWNFINYVGSVWMILCIFWVCKSEFFGGFFFWVWWQVQILSLINCWQSSCWLCLKFSKVDLEWLGNGYVLIWLLRKCQKRKAKMFFPQGRTWT